MICIELVEEGVLSIENASSFLNITKDDFDKAINELKFETGNWYREEYYIEKLISCSKYDIGGLVFGIIRLLSRHGKYLE